MQTVEILTFTTLLVIYENNHVDRDIANKINNSFLIHYSFYTMPLTVYFSEYLKSLLRIPYELVHLRRD